MCSSDSRRCESDCVSEDGGDPGRWFGEQPVESSILGTRRLFLVISVALLRTSSRSFTSFGSVVRDFADRQDLSAYAADHCCVAYAYKSRPVGVRKGGYVK